MPLPHPPTLRTPLRKNRSFCHVRHAGRDNRKKSVNNDQRLPRSSAAALTLTATAQLAAQLTAASAPSSAQRAEIRRNHSTDHRNFEARRRSFSLHAALNLTAQLDALLAPRAELDVRRLVSRAPHRAPALLWTVRRPGTKETATLSGDDLARLLCRGENTDVHGDLIIPLWSLSCGRGPQVWSDIWCAGQHVRQTLQQLTENLIGALQPVQEQPLIDAACWAVQISDVHAQNPGFAVA